jgi:hypothetical protein
MPLDIRWQQRPGSIQAFADCFDLRGSPQGDLSLAEGYAGLIGSRDTLRLAFRVGLIRA